MRRVSEQDIHELFPPDGHPYRRFEKYIEQRVGPVTVLLDAGCGRTAPLLQRYGPRVHRALGLDMVDLERPSGSNIVVFKADLASTGLHDSSIDLVISRSVLEHIANPQSVYTEVARILKPGGEFVFLTPNLWDYASICGMLIPNALHPWLVKRLEGRAEEDTFPTCYRSNTAGAVRRLAQDSGLILSSVEYLGQYPCYFLFSRSLFYAAAWYEKLLSRFDALAFLRGWLLVVVKKPLTPESVHISIPQDTTCAA